MSTAAYNRRMQELIDHAQQLGRRPRLLLHCCCAPCSSAVLERLSQAFDITLYYYNPNMDTQQEHDLRARQMNALLKQSGQAQPLVIEPYAPAHYQRAVAGLEQEREGGLRCARCFALRLQQSAQYAKAQGFDWFTTTLTISPMKSAPLLNQLGEAIGAQAGIPFLPSDFKKRGGYQRSVELSRQYGLYRQDYCGCAFSRRERQARQKG